MTWDHVFPDAWYPTTTSPKTEKWKVPSCLSCNQGHSKNEGDLLLRLGLCIDPDDPRNAGIVEKALRALNPAQGKNLRDAKLRAATGQKILRQSFHGNQIPYQAVYPGFGPLPDMHPSEHVAITISAAGLNKLTEKIVRGITFVLDGRFIEPPYRIQFYALHEEAAQPIVELLERFGQSIERPPGLRITRAVVPEDRTTAVFRIEMWSSLRTYAFIGIEDETVT